MKSLACAALAVCVSVVVSAQAGGGRLLVLSKGALTLSVVDPSTLKVLGTVPSGPDPHEVAVSPDGRTAYISNYGAADTITVVDLAAMAPLPPIDMGALHQPHGLMFAAGKLWFTAEGAKVVGSYDPASRKIDLILGSGQDRTHMVLASADGSRIVTSNVQSATLSFFERTAGGPGRGGPPAGGPPRGGAPGGPPATPGGPPPPGGRGGPAQGNWSIVVVPVGRGAEGFDISPDGKQLWAANAQDGTISVVDVATKAVTETLQANVMGANRLKFTLDGKHVLVSTLSGPDVVVLDAATRKEIKRIPVGRGAAGYRDGARRRAGLRGLHARQLRGRDRPFVARRRRPYSGRTAARRARLGRVAIIRAFPPVPTSSGSVGRAACMQSCGRPPN